MYRKLFSRKLVSGVAICSFIFLAAACGPSDEKVDEAQQKYSQLVQMHNQVVEAHKNVEDNSLDESLAQLQEKASEAESYNLAEMKDEEIDILIGTMDDLIQSYEEYLEILSDIKGKEEAAVLIPISVTVTNNTDLSFSTLKLYEKGDHDVHADVLEDMEHFAPGQTLVGLMVLRDVDNTPWMLVLEEAGGTEYELELPVEEYEEEGISLALTYDQEQNKLLAE